MLFSKSTSKVQSSIDTLISENTKLFGDVEFDGGLRVDGTISGKVTELEGHESTLVLSETGRIEGGIKASHVLLNGKVTGPVHAAHYVELQSKARVIGDIYYKTLEIHLGAVVEGNLIYQGDDQATKSQVD